MRSLFFEPVDGVYYELYIKGGRISPRRTEAKCAGKFCHI